MAEKATAVVQKLGQVGSRMVAKNAARGQRFWVWSSAKGKIFWKYAKVEMRPPTFGEFPEVASKFRQVINTGTSGKWKEIPARDAWMNTVICMEILCWFFIGECIGKRSLVGYNVWGCYLAEGFDPGHGKH